jgi:hypothetical protein
LADAFAAIEPQLNWKVRAGAETFRAIAFQS